MKVVTVVLLTLLIVTTRQNVIRRDADEINKPPKPQQPPACVELTEDDHISHFLEGGCNVHHDNETMPFNCYLITNCPEKQCYDNNRPKQLRNADEIWFEKDGKKHCECVPPGHKYYFASPPPKGAAYPLLHLCRTNGCLQNEKLYNEGESEKIEGRNCTCYPGPDIEMMDAATLFHWRCAEYVIIEDTVEVKPTVPAPEVIPEVKIPGLGGKPDVDEGKEEPEVTEESEVTKKPEGSIEVSVSDNTAGEAGPEGGKKAVEAWVDFETNKIET